MLDYSGILQKEERYSKPKKNDPMEIRMPHWKDISNK
jgi:hypothetical protein